MPDTADPTRPTADCQYAHLPRTGPGIDHHYGENVHLLSHPYPMTLLARLSANETVQPAVNHLVTSLYDWMLAEVASRELATCGVRIPTRMQKYNSEGVYEGEIIDRRQRVVVVDIARAGILPSLRVYHGLHQLVDPENLRQDHIIASRQADAAGRVVGLKMDVTKLGGPIEDATVLLPDPMAATGTSIAGVISHYLAHAGGVPRRIVTMHLIATPEYLKAITRAFPQVIIYAIRLDRGLSPPDVLATVPGARWDEEVGLNATQYIIPGAGGVGEVLNNAWV